MKTLLLITCLSVAKISSALTIQEVRKLYVKAVDDEDVAEQLYNDLKQTEDPILKGYKGAVQTILAKHYYNPVSKWSYFQDGCKELDEAVSNKPNDPELRFLRFSIQTNAPGFLGYTANIYEDKEVILDNLAMLKFDSNNEMRTMILDYMLQTSFCSTEEKKKIRASLASN